MGGGRSHCLMLADADEAAQKNRMIALRKVLIVCFGFAIEKLDKLLSLLL